MSRLTDPTRANKQSKPSSMLGDYDDELIETHEYDGIQEYDNPMPGWWAWLFIVTVIWSAAYFVAISMGYIDTYDEDLAEGQAEITKLRDQNEAQNPAVDAQMLAAAIGVAERISAGQAAYAQSCASCHGQKGEGMIGPNLTDEFWIHGGQSIDIYKTIAEGVSAKGMPAWEGIVAQEDLIAIVAYIDSIQGSDPPNAKAAQGKANDGGS